MSDQEVETPAMPTEELPMVPDLAGVPSAHLVNVMWRFAACINKAPYLPASARGNQQAVFFLLAKSNDLGIKWTHGLGGGLYMTPGGRTGMEGNVALSLLYKNHFRVLWPTYSEDAEFDKDGKLVAGRKLELDKEARCQICRPECSCKLDFRQKRVICECGASFEEGFSLSEAQKIIATERDEQTGDKVRKTLAEKFNYKNWSRDMYRWRALMRTGRIIASDVLHGSYSMEEVKEILLTERDGVFEPESRPEALGRMAGEKQPPPNESLIPTELESALATAAHEAGKGQDYVRSVLESIAGIAKELAPELQLQSVRQQVAKAVAQLAEMKAKEPPKKPTRRARASDLAKEPVPASAQEGANGSAKTEPAPKAEGSPGTDRQKLPTGEQPAVQGGAVNLFE